MYMDNQYQVQTIVEKLLDLSDKLHPSYTRVQHWAWVTGMLAEVVVEKNFMDSIVLSRFNDRLKELKRQAKSI